MVDNTILEEPYVKNEKIYNSDIFHIPVGNLFLLGDNRMFSRDSREFGFVDIDKVMGKVFLIYFPFIRFRWLL